MTPETHYTIRRARLEDVNPVAELIGIEVPVLKARVIATEKQPTAHVLCVVEVQIPPHIIGTGYLHPWMRAAEISDVMIHPNYRRKGIAHQVMQTLINAAIAHGYPAVQLTCAITNTPALNLYHKLGFSIKRQLVLDELILFLMERRLN